MKKIIFIVISLMLTGCLGEVGQGIITKNCKKYENGVNTNIEIKSKVGKLETIVITEVYDDITSVLNSKKSEQNLYKQLNGIDLDINNNTLTYTIDVNNTTDLIKDRFNIKLDVKTDINIYLIITIVFFKLIFSFKYI